MVREERRREKEFIRCHDYTNATKNDIKFDLDTGDLVK
jgi:hypothetical protein